MIDEARVAEQFAPPVPGGSERARRVRHAAGSLNPSFWVGTAILVGLLVASFVVPALSPYGVREANPADALQPPSARSVTARMASDSPR